MKKEEIAQWVIDNRYAKSEKEKVSDFEMYHLLIEKIEALSICEVNRSLPTMDERNLEVKRLTHKLYKKDDYFGKSNFTQGFRAAFVWLRTKPSENG